MNSFTNVYWMPSNEFNRRGVLYPLSKDNGIHFEIPYESPVTAGYFHGENPPIENVRKSTVVTDSRPELFTVAGVMPSVNGVPHILNKSMGFDRSAYTKEV